MATSANSVSSVGTRKGFSAIPAVAAFRWVRRRDKHLWRSIDFLHIAVMIFSLFTAVIISSLQNELSEQCPLYAQLFLRNVTDLSADTFDTKTTWTNVYLCDFTSFAYFSAFVVSFISLWLHVVFRRVVLTERLLRFPIWLLTLTFALVTLVATCLVTDGIIKFCANSQAALCTSSGAPAFRNSRWKIISWPIGGWLTTLSLLLNTVVRTVQLCSKPKKSPETLSFLLKQVMDHRRQNKVDKEQSEYDSRGSPPAGKREEREEPIRPYRPPTDDDYHREFPRDPYLFYPRPMPKVRRVEKRSWFQRVCCPCFRRRRQRRQRLLHDPYQAFVVPDEYFHRLNYLREDGMNTIGPTNLCHHHSTHRYPAERQGQSNPLPRRKSDDDLSEAPFQPRRRSSVRFEDEPPVAKSAEEISPSTPDPPPLPPPPVKQPEESSTEVQNDLQRSVSFRNNEDDLWTTITINAEQSVPVQSSHFNRLTLENMSQVDTSLLKNDNGVTAIHINGKPIESFSSGNAEQTPSSSLPKYRVAQKRHKQPPLSIPASHSYTPSSEDETDLRNIKPVEEINANVADKYNYEDLSNTLKSNVERLKSAFLRAQQSSATESHYDTPRNVQSMSPRQYPSHMNDVLSDC